MSSILRRAGSKLAQFLQRSGDPSPVAGRAYVFAKDVSGTAKVFVMDSAGDVRMLGADSAATDTRQVSTGVDPGALATTEQTTGGVIFAGSLIGFSARLENAVTSGSIVVNIKVNGTTKLTATLNVSNPTFVRAIADIGVHPVVEGDNVSVELVPSGYSNSGPVQTLVTTCVTLMSSFDEVFYQRKVTSVKTTNYNAVAGEYIPCDPSSASFDVVIPLAASVVPGTVIWIKHDSTSPNSVSAVRSGSDTLDNLTTLSIETLEQFEFTSDGISKWRIGQ